MSRSEQYSPATAAAYELCRSLHGREKCACANATGGGHCLAMVNTVWRIMRAAGIPTDGIDKIMTGPVRVARASVKGGAK